MPVQKHQVVHWLPDSDYAKAVGQFKLQLNGVFSPFNMYGLNEYVPGAKKQAVDL